MPGAADIGGVAERQSVGLCSPEGPIGIDGTARRAPMSQVTPRIASSRTSKVVELPSKAESHRFSSCKAGFRPPERYHPMDG